LIIARRTGRFSGISTTGARFPRDAEEYSELELERIVS